MATCNPPHLKKGITGLACENRTPKTLYARFESRFDGMRRIPLTVLVITDREPQEEGWMEIMPAAFLNPGALIAKPV